MERLPGVGTAIRDSLREHGVERVVDLLLRPPLRFEDRSRVWPIASLGQAQEPVVVRGRVVAVRARRALRRRLRLVEASFEDGTGTLGAVWFNQPWIARELEDGGERVLFGVVRDAPGGGLQLVNPDLDRIGDAPRGTVAVYRAVGALRGRRLARVMAVCVEAAVEIDDPLPDDVRRAAGLPPLGPCLVAMHGGGEGPPAPSAADARRRVAFDELLAHACRIERERRRRSSERTEPVRLTTSADEMAARLLPFEPTGAQRRTIAEIAADLTRDRPMARLLEGDVGCGKTAVAATVMAMVAVAGGQVALMAPTELLAEQHHRVLCRLLAPVGVRPLLLTGSLAASDRREALNALAAGDGAVAIGTHALFQQAVRFARLRLVVVDEQHRFGVEERRSLADKGVRPHQLVMSATPIPRSLALTAYGDLDLSVIDELPPGRRPVRTVVRAREPNPRLDRFLREEIAAGGRVYLVYPRIEIDKGDPQVPAVLADLEAVRARLPGVAVGVVHGRMPAPERERVTDEFRRGRIQALLATTVIEVGVDVPEASVMVVEGADRFGLAQLHQLRGRVGRGTRSSWCILRTAADAGSAGRRRLAVLCRHHDGFEVAEADLAQRGPGDPAGRHQSGRIRFRFADLVRDRRRLAVARGLAARLGDDGRLDEVAAALGAIHRPVVAAGAG